MPPIRKNRQIGENTVESSKLGVIGPLTKCVFCGFQLIVRNADLQTSKFLECFHTVCAICLVLWQNKETKICPECNLVIDKNLLETKIIQELISYQHWSSRDKNPLCGEHKDKIASHWCENCSDFVCETCVENHNQLKSTKSHKMKSRQEYFESVAEEKEIFPCEKHPNEKLLIYCLTCEQMTCKDCQLNSHAEHQYKFICDIVDVTKLELHKRNVFLRHRLNIIEQGVDAIEMHKESLQLQGNLIKEGLSASIENLIIELRLKEKQMCDIIDESVINKVRQLEEQKKILQRHSKAMKHCTTVTSEILKISSDSSIIHAKRYLMKLMDKIGKNVVTMPNPRFQTKVEFQSSIPNLLKGLDKLGDLQWKNSCNISVDTVKQCLTSALNREQDLETWANITDMKWITSPRNQPSSMEVDVTPSTVTSSQISDVSNQLNTSSNRSNLVGDFTITPIQAIEQIDLTDEPPSHPQSQSSIFDLTDEPPSPPPSQSSFDLTDEPLSPSQPESSNTAKNPLASLATCVSVIPSSPRTIPNVPSASTRADKSTSPPPSDPQRITSKHKKCPSRSSTSVLVMQSGQQGEIDLTDDPPSPPMVNKDVSTPLPLASLQNTGTSVSPAKISVGTKTSIPCSVPIEPSPSTPTDKSATSIPSQPQRKNLTVRKFASENSLSMPVLQYGQQKQSAHSWHLPVETNSAELVTSNVSTTPPVHQSIPVSQPSILTQQLSTPVATSSAVPRMAPQTTQVPSSPQHQRPILPYSLHTNLTARTESQQLVNAQPSSAATAQQQNVCIICSAQSYPINVKCQFCHRAFHGRCLSIVSIEYPHYLSSSREICMIQRCLLCENIPQLKQPYTVPMTALERRVCVRVLVEIISNNKSKIFYTPHKGIPTPGDTFHKLKEKFMRQEVFENGINGFIRDLKKLFLQCADYHMKTNGRSLIVETLMITQSIVSKYLPDSINAFNEYLAK